MKLSGGGSPEFIDYMPLFFSSRARAKFASALRVNPMSAGFETQMRTLQESQRHDGMSPISPPFMWCAVPSEQNGQHTAGGLGVSTCRSWLPPVPHVWASGLEA